MFLYDLLPGKWGDDAITRGWIAYANGELQQAADAFGRAVARDPKKFGYLRYNRASALLNLQRVDSAAAELATLLAQLREQDSATVGQGYQSKELLEYAAGMLNMLQRRTAEAKQSFARSVTENPGFVPAHAMLGDLALQKKDTTSALLEYATAVEIDPSDVMLRLGYGKVLLAAGRSKDAVTQMRAAVALEPFFAAAYFRLGNALEVSGDTKAATAAYAQFVARAPREDPLRAQAEEVLKILSAPNDF